jgi:hypothetical protein
MKSPDTSQNWHTRAARLLHYPFENRWDNLVVTLKAIPLLPLQDGTWVSGSSGPVYFGHVDGMDIPADVDLRFISRNVSNKDRIILFEDLGVKPAPVALVRKKILQIYPGEKILPSSLSISDSKRHLEFLYRTHHTKGDAEPSYRCLAIHDKKGQLWHPFREDMYIANDKPYEPWELFKRTAPGPNPGDGAPVYPGQECHYRQHLQLS